MPLLGNTSPLTLDAVALQPDTIYGLSALTLTEPQAIAKWSIWLGGSGEGAGLLRGVVLNATSGAVVTVGDELSVSGHIGEGWVDLPAGGAVGAILSAGQYIFGVWYGGTPGSVRAAVSDSVGVMASGVPYSAPAPATVTTVPGPDIVLFALVFDAWSPPDADDMTLGRLPWGLSQRALGVANVPADTPPTVPGLTCGWHGVNFDEETGAFAVARTGGPCEDLAGERVLITRRHGLYVRQATVVLYSARPFPSEVSDEDVSLTRRAYMALADWADDTVGVDATVLP